MVYAQHVCKNALIGFDRNGNMKPVSLSYLGKTLCNNAWMDKIPTHKITPVCKIECVDCKAQGKVYPDIHPIKTPRVITQEHKDKMIAAKKGKSNG